MPAMVQFRDGPSVPYGPDVDMRAFVAWAERHRDHMVYRDQSDEELLHVYAFEDGECVVLIQGGDIIAVPLEEYGRFVDALEKVYAS